MAVDPQKEQRFFRHEFLILWGAAATVDALSTLLMHLPLAGLARQLFIPFRSDSEMLTLIAVITQNCIQMAITVGVGLVVARRLGLGAPVLESWLRRDPIRPRLRAQLVPIVLTILLFVGCSAFANSSVFHPNRKQDSATANQIANSPASEQLMERLEKLGLGGSKPITPVVLLIVSLSNSISGGLNARLFKVSVMILLLMQIFGKRNTARNRAFLWTAIVLVPVIDAAFSVTMQHENTLMIASVFRSLGILHSAGTPWLAVATIIVRLVPTGVALGWLYVNYGLEASIVASFGAAAMNYLILFRFF